MKNRWVKDCPFSPVLIVNHEFHKSLNVICAPEIDIGITHNISKQGILDWNGIVCFRLIVMDM